MTAPEAVAAIRSWYRLDRAFEAVNQAWRAEYGVSGEQVAVLRIVAEREVWPLAEMRARLSMHPATLGQLLARLEAKSMVVVRPADDDARRRLVTITKVGRELLAQLPVVGPVRLRSVSADPEQLRALAEAFTQAIELFGLAEFAPPQDSPSDRTPSPPAGAASSSDASPSSAQPGAVPSPSGGGTNHDTERKQR